MGSVCCYDISHYEKDTATSFHTAYDNGYILAICKATQGATQEDNAFRSYIKRLKTVQGQLIGAYHFGTTDNVKEQAEHFLQVVGSIPLLVLDWEPNINTTMTLQQAEEFVEHIAIIRGKYPLLYSGYLAKETNIPKHSPLLKCELWLAQYSAKAELPAGWDKYRLWQFTGDGVGPMPHDIDGIGTNVDISRFPGTLEDCRRWYHSLL